MFTRKEKKKLMIDAVIALAIVLVATCVFKPVIVRETSMEPGIQEGNHLVLVKTAYIRKEHPNYGDIIVFRSGANTGKKLFVKRVIGTEGDSITLKDGDVLRNGKKIDEPYVDGQATYLPAKDEGEKQEKTWTVDKDRVFVMGDNRKVSLDSRYDDIGEISEDQIVGKAIVKMQSLTKISLLN